MYRIGDELKGQARKHPGIILIIDDTPLRTYHVMFKGGQHNGKKTKRLPRHVVDTFYAPNKKLR
jgi:hypothetical protein